MKILSRTQCLRSYRRCYTSAQTTQRNTRDKVKYLQIFRTSRQSSTRSVLNGISRLHLDYMSTSILLHDGNSFRTIITINNCNLNVFALSMNILSQVSDFQEWSNNDAVAILTYFILLVSFTFNIFIFCYIGELLVNQVLLAFFIFPYFHSRMKTLGSFDRSLSLNANSAEKLAQPPITSNGIVCLQIKVQTLFY